MKQLFALTTIILSIPLLAQQVPNGGFEEWESTPMFSLDPVNWETDNTQLLISASQDLDAFEGEYAMRVDPLNFGLGEYGEASTTIDMGGLPDGLHFYVKYQRTFTAAVGVTVDFFNDEEIVHSEYWAPIDTASAWIPVQMTFPPIDVATTHAVIRVFVGVGDFAPGSGWISVDAMDFGILNSLEDLSPIDISLFPNPADQFVEIRIEDAVMVDAVYIMDISGRIMLQAPFEKRLDVTSMAEGQYILELRNADRVIGQRKFQVQR